MAEENKKNDGPSCACGKGDLYEEWLKNENKKKEASKSAASNDSDDSKADDESVNKKA